MRDIEQAAPWGRVRRAARLAGGTLVVGSAAALVAACTSAEASGGRIHSSAGTPARSAGSHARTEHITLLGKVDADSGAPGTFTGMDGWPALAPSEIHVSAGAKVVFTIKEYDDMITPIHAMSPFHAVTGGTETVDGKRVTGVSNMQLAHTITIPALGINIPLPVAPSDDESDGPMGDSGGMGGSGTGGSGMGSGSGMGGGSGMGNGWAASAVAEGDDGGGYTTVTFTFTAPSKPGTYRWLCVTPCGGDPNGVGGAMQKDGWMRGHLVVT